MSPFDQWLQRVTRHLSQPAVAQITTELREHYESHLEALLATGIPDEEAAAQALAALGDAKALNREYRKIHLTTAEANTLRSSNMEARAFCSTNARKRATLLLPLAFLLTTVIWMLFAAPALNRTPWLLFTSALGITMIFAAPSLPIYTPRRARIFRAGKYAVLLALIGFSLQWSTLMIVCLWPFLYNEFTRASIRRKLPVDQWPKQLYL